MKLGRQSHGRCLRVENTFDRLPHSVRPFAHKVSLALSPRDGMYVEGKDSHYFCVGASALNAILSTLALGQIGDPKSILDFGAGSGRVLRWIRAAFENAAVYACDLRQEEMTFCSEQFGARTFLSDTNIDKTYSPVSYDLIWVGSVFTHLPAHSCAKLLDKLLSWCAPQGLIIFSTIGRLPAGRLDGREAYHPSGWKRMLRGYHRSGFGYADYDYEQGYGLALAKPSWYVSAVERNRSVRLVMFGEALWDNHHDLWALQKRAIDKMLETDEVPSADGAGSRLEHAFEIEYVKLKAFWRLFSGL